MMSFSKAKLKRFNEMTDFSSPFTKEKPKKDKKAGLFLDDNAIPSDKKSKMRLFRTPSLPYRLKFRQVSDLSTPSKKGSKAPAFSVLTPTPASTPLTTPIEPPPPVSIFRKSERNLLEKKSRDEKYIEKLKVDIDDLNKKLALLHLQNAQRVDEIDDLNNDIDNMEVAEEFLEKIAAQAINKISESDEKVKEILHNYDILLHHMDRMSCENENLLELNANLTTSNDEFTKLNEERIHEMEKKLKVKSDELLRMRQKVIERNTVSKHFEFELGKKTMENYGLNVKLEKSVENFKIFEVQHEENMKMLKNSYETEIFFLHTKLSNTQIQLTKIAKNQKRMHSMDMESQIDFENQKKSFEMEKKKFNIAFKEYETIIEVLSKRLRESDTGVEVVMAENKELKSEIATLRLNYEKLRISAENLKKNFDDKNKLFEQLMSSSEMEMMTMVSKMNDYFNEKFSEIAELKKSFDIRDKNLKKMTSTILEEYTIGIELARLELDDKQKKIVDYENEIKTIKLENLQLKMKLSESNSHKTATLETIEEETATDDEKKNIQEREEENQQLKSKLKELDRKFAEFESAATQRESEYEQKLKASNLEMRSKFQKLQESYQIFDSPTKTPTKRALLYGKENQSPIFVGQARAQFEQSPKAILKPRN